MDRDAELVERARSGDRAAFKELVTSHRRNVFSLALNFMRNREDAEDISQEVFVKAYHALASFRSDAKFSSWLYRITVNTCLSHKGKKDFSASRGLDEMDEVTDAAGGNADPERTTESSFLRSHLEQALSVLSARERTVFILRNYSELAFEEIVELLKIRPGTVRNLNFKALKKLRKELQYYRNES